MVGIGKAILLFRAYRFHHCASVPPVTTTLSSAEIGKVGNASLLPTLHG